MINIEGKWGCIDQKGKLVIPCTYDGIWEAREGLIGVKKGELCGYLDLAGKVVIKPQYSGISGFCGGIALCIKPGEDTENLIDKQGNILINGQEHMLITDDGRYVYIRENNKWGIIKNPLQ